MLIVIDMQRDFITGPLGTPQSRAIVPAVAARILRAREEGTQVIFALDTHEEDYAASREGRLLPVRHALRGSEGWALAPEIGAVCSRGMLSIEKSAFSSPALSRHVSEIALLRGSPMGCGLRIELCGVCTDKCLISNALLLRSALPEADVVVDSRLCAGSTPELHRSALDVMRSCQIEVL